MSEAFAERADFVLYVSEAKEPQKNIFQLYGVRTPFRFEVLALSKKKPRAIRAAFALKKIVDASPEGTVFYIREGLPAFFLLAASSRFRNNFFYEAHSFSRHAFFFYKNIFRYARGIIATNFSKAEIFKKRFGVAADKLLVAPNAIDLGDFKNIPTKVEARRKLALSLDKQIVVFVGKPSAERGIDLILEVARVLGDEALFLAVGGSESEIKKLEVIPGFQNIKFIGQKPHSEVATYMAAADVLIGPNSGKFHDLSLYASPLKTLEYLASGTPAILSAIPAMQEMVPDEFATFATPDAPQIWAEHIRHILTHRVEAEERASRGREYALMRNWGSRSEKILQFMQKTII